MAMTTSSSSSSSSSSSASAVWPKKLIVRNLSLETEEFHLFALLEAFGKIRKITIITDHQGRSRGFGFVTFFRHEDAAEALQHMQGATLDYMILDLAWAKNKRRRR